MQLKGRRREMKPSWEAHDEKKSQTGMNEYKVGRKRAFYCTCRF